IHGFDANAGIVEVAQRNAARAGVGALVDIATQVVADLDLPPGPGLVIANPPYGKRLDAERTLYAHLGRHSRRAGWRLALLAGDPRLLAAAGRSTRTWPLVNGGLRATLGLFSASK